MKCCLLAEEGDQTTVLYDGMEGNGLLFWIQAGDGDLSSAEIGWAALCDEVGVSLTV